MGKNFLTYALVLTLMSIRPVHAENAKLNFQNFVNLKEIVLDTAQNSYISSSENNPTDSFLATENTPATKELLKTNDNTPSVSKKERKFFSFLNPVKEVKFLNKGVESGVKNIDTVVNKGMKKLENTPFEVVEKTDEKVDKGVVHLEGTVDKGLDILEKAVDVPLETMDKVLNVQINKTSVQQWMDGDYASERFFGERPLLESHGITINSSYLYSPFMKTGGGASGENGYKGYGLFNLGVTVDTEKAGLWKGGTFFALYQNKRGYGLSGANPDGAMGDFMGFDGWDWRQINQISEYWYQQKFIDGKIRVKLGKQDANTDFAYLNSGWDFMNSAFSVTPNVPLVTYPDQSFGFMAEINPKEWLSIRDGVYSRFNVPFNITEIEFKPKIKNLPGRYMLGAWELSDSSGMQTLAGEDTNGTYYNNFNRNFGAYLIGEQMVYKEKKDDNNDMQGLVAFGQVGIAPSNQNDMNRYVGVGLHYLGPIPKRDKDIAGIAVGSGNFAPRLNDITFANGGRTGSETVIEAFYRYQVSKWFYLQPDVQYIMNPSGMYPSSVAIGLRSVITF